MACNGSLVRMNQVAEIGVLPLRGVALMTRSGSYGLYGHEAVASANSRILKIIQIESSRSLLDVHSIAAQDGVDVPVCRAD